MKGLTDERADRSAGLNDWAFRTEGTACTNCDCRRDGLQDGHSRGDTAAVEQHRFHRFWNAVALNFRRSVLGHDTHDQTANERRHDYHPAEMVVLRAREGARPPMVEKKIGEQADQLVESEGDYAGHNADGGG